MFSNSFCIFSRFVFFVFNLLPIYPLDGFRAIDIFCKRRGKVYRFLRDKGVFVLYVLIFLSIFADIVNVWQLDILGFVVRYVGNLICIPIDKFWGLIF